MSKTTSDLLVERLIQWGVDTVFGLPGDGINGVFEALRTRQESIRFVQVRHEEAAAFAACGYAKYTGRLGVCLATSGPGGIHLLNGLYDAKCDGQPVLAITGHTFHDLIGTRGQQDVDLSKLFGDVAAYSERVMGPAHVVNVIDEAVKTALGKHTVAHVTIPKDVQDWTVKDDVRSASNIDGHSASLFVAERSLPGTDQLSRAADAINAGTRVAILAGRGCLGARQEVLDLADRVAGPIIKPLLGKGVVDDDHVLTTGGIGLLGTAPSQDAITECDTLVILGSSFPYLEFYPKPGQARAVQIDVDSTRLGLRHSVEVGLVGDCGTVLRALLPLITRKDDRTFLETAQHRMQQWNHLMEMRGTQPDIPMKPQVVAHALNDVLTNDAIVSADSGTIATWAARHVRIRGDMQFSLSGNLATMANALPYSVGAAIAYPGRQVVAIVGDGGLTMLMGELATLAKYQLPVKVIVFKNDMLGMIKWEQVVFEGTPQFGVELQPIDFPACARACGVAGFTVSDPSQLAGVLREAFDHPGPALVEAVIDPDEPPLPGHITTTQAARFAEALVKGEPGGWNIIKSVAKAKIRELL